jgi:hypothetical protein
MMGAVIRLPLDTAAFDRLTARARNANIAADRSDWVRIARSVLRSPKYHPDQVIRDACSVLETWGDGMDWQLADEAIQALNLRERQLAHEAARRAAAEETSVKIAMRYRPELLAVGKGVLLAVLVAVVFNVAVLP